MAERWAIFALIPCMVLICLYAPGCGQETPEQTVYKFLGAVQAHDSRVMRSCINPDAVHKAADGSGEIARQWEELHRRYIVEPVNWRMAFQGIRLESSFLESDRALVRLVGGKCELYNLKEGTWAITGKIDFSTQDFVPLYVVLQEGHWYLEALDLYIVYGLESMARL